MLGGVSGASWGFLPPRWGVDPTPWSWGRGCGCRWITGAQQKNWSLTSTAVGRSTASPSSVTSSRATPKGQCCVQGGLGVSGVSLGLCSHRSLTATPTSSSRSRAL